MQLDDAILGLLEESHGMTFSEIKKALGDSKIRDKALSNTLKRLQKFMEIRKILYCDWSSRPKTYYILFNDDRFLVPCEDKNDPYICTCLRREVRLDGMPCYYFVYLNYFGEEIDRDLTPCNS